MSPSLTRNHFELFSLPQQYALDSSELDARYRDLQRTVHPDRYASAGDQERRMSMQQAAHINEAYRVLKDPLGRGRYLLELHGHPIGEQHKTHQDPAFLMQQMELRERLAEIRQQAHPLQALDGLAAEVDSQYRELQEQLAAALDRDADFERAITLVLRMQFFTRLRGEVHELQGELEDELY